MSEHIPGKEQLPDKPNIGEIRDLVKDASTILEKQVLEGKTKTYFDDPSELIKSLGLNARGETTPAVIAVLDADEYRLVIDKSHEQARNPYMTLSILEPHVAGGQVYTSETVLRIELKTLKDLKNEQPVPPDSTATWIELLDETNKKTDLQEDFDDTSWLSDDAESRELDRETFERFKAIIAELK